MLGSLCIYGLVFGYLVTWTMYPTDVDTRQHSCCQTLRLGYKTKLDVAIEHSRVCPNTLRETFLCETQGLLHSGALDFAYPAHPLLRHCTKYTLV